MEYKLLRFPFIAAYYFREFVLWGHLQGEPECNEDVINEILFWAGRRG